MTHYVLVDRLIQHVAPFSILGFDQPPMLEWIESLPRQGWLEMLERDQRRQTDLSWDGGRIATFIDKIRAGEDLDPIEIDNHCDGGNIYPWPILIDGYHRFCAVLLLGKPTIKATYGGLVDVLDWLTGDTSELIEK